MSSPSNGNESGSNLQRLAIGAGTLIVVVLTVVVAIFLTLQEGFFTGEPTPISNPTPIVVASPSPTFTSTSLPAVDTPPPTFTSISSTSGPTAPPTPIATDTPLPPPPPTFTPLPPPPTFTPVVEQPTNTPAVAANQTPPPCQPPVDWVEYVAQVGDTFDSLARRTGTSVADLLEVNCPQTATLAVGQRVYLPITPPTPTPTYTPSPTSPPAATPTRTTTPIAPKITTVSPKNVNTGNEPFTMTVLGENFKTREAGFRVELHGPKTVPLTLVEPTVSEISFNVTVPANLDEGTYDLIVTNANGNSDIEARALIVGPEPTPSTLPQPNITNFNPIEGSISEDVELLITGENFRPDNNPDFQVELRPTIAGRASVPLDELGPILSETTIEATIPAARLEVGDYRIVVFNDEEKFDISEGVYRATE